MIISTASAWAAGSITGVVTFEGNAPHAKLLHMDADPICYAINKGNVTAQTVLVGDHNSLANVFVYIKSGLVQAEYPAPAQAAVVNQAGCNYSPHVLGVMVGQKVKFLNPDGTLHNVHAVCQVNPQFNASMPDFRREMEVAFNKPEFMFPIQCDVHPWMKAWMAVMSHPFFAVTAKDGKFEIKGLPAGTYTIEAWQERLGTKSSVVTVTDGGAQRIDFTFSTPN